MKFDGGTCLKDVLLRAGYASLSQAIAEITLFFGSLDC